MTSLTRPAPTAVSTSAASRYRAIQQRPAVAFRTPRPSAVSWIVQSGKVDPDATTFYEDGTVVFDAAPDKDVDLKVSLKATDVLVLAGSVTGADGQPVPGAQLYAFAGNANEKTWADQAVPRLSGSSWTVRDKMLASVSTDEDGRFRLRVV